MRLIGVVDNTVDEDDAPFFKFAGPFGFTDVQGVLVPGKQSHPLRGRLSTTKNMARTRKRIIRGPRT